MLTYHVVPGRLTWSDLDELIRKANGSTALKTVSGGSLWLMKNGDRNITVKDETGAVADIAVYDVPQSNGVIHSNDRVLLPRCPPKAKSGAARQAPLLEAQLHVGRTRAGPVEAGIDFGFLACTSID